MLSSRTIRDPARFSEARRARRRRGGARGGGGSSSGLLESPFRVLRNFIASDVARLLHARALCALPATSFRFARRRLSRHASRKHTVGSRVSSLFVAKLDSATIDDGALQPAGTSGESLRTRRAAAFRHRIFGTNTAYVDLRTVRVKWDSPNYKAHHNGVLESMKDVPKLSHEPLGAGTGPNTKRAIREHALHVTNARRRDRS